MPTATNGNVQSDGFRVLIAGGGPVGLALGVMLQRKGIDFLILERSPQVIVDSGACILVWPHATRLFHSMGLLEALEGRFLQTHNKVTMHLDGKVTADDFVFDWLEEK